MPQPRQQNKPVARNLICATGQLAVDTHSGAGLVCLPARLLVIFALGLCITLLPISAIASSDPPLLETIASLRLKGYRILYSSDLVKPGQTLAIDEVSIKALRTALPLLSLKLKRVGRIWVITRTDEQLATASGYLLSQQGDPVVNGQVTAVTSGATTYSALDGYFELRPAANDELLEISADGYQSQQLPTQSISDRPVVLLPDGWIETIIVTGSRYHIPHYSGLLSSTFLSAEEMNLLPAMGGDAMRVVTKLPGVSSVGVTAKPQVRGGLSDEVLILMDGVELLDPFHLADFYSVFSTIDDRTIDSIDFYTGGFPARYGNRMSAVMDVSSAMPVAEPGTELGISLFSTFLNTRGVSDGEMPTDWIVSARRGNLSEISKLTSANWGEPSYADAYARVAVNINDATNLHFGAVAVSDDVVLTDAEESAGSEVNTQHIWSRLNRRISEDFYTSLVMSYLHSERQQFQRIVEEATDPEGEVPDVPGFLDYDQSLKRFTLRNDYSRALSGGHLLEFGLQAEYGDSDYAYASRIDRGVIAEVLGLESIINGDRRIATRGWSGGGYASMHVQLTPKLALQPGLRWDFQDYYIGTSSDQFSPRMGISYEPNAQLRLSASAGRFYQPEGQYELQLRDGQTSFSMPQKSDQVIVGMEWERNKLRLKGEAYYKRYNQLKPRYENLFNTFVLLPHMLPDRVPIAPDKAVVEGFELEASYALSENLSGQLRYSAMDAADRINGKWVARRWSQRHTVHTGLTWQDGSFNMSAGLTWHSGWRTSRLPSSVAVDTVLPIEEVINNSQLPDYLSLDVSMSKTWQAGKTEITLHGDITNLLNRKNVAGVEYDIEETDDAILFTEGKTTLLPIVPSIGVIIAF